MAVTELTQEEEERAAQGSSSSALVQPLDDLPEDAKIALDREASDEDKLVALEAWVARLKGDGAPAGAANGREVSQDFGPHLVEGHLDGDWLLAHVEYPALKALAADWGLSVTDDATAEQLVAAIVAEPVYVRASDELDALVGGMTVDQLHQLAAALGISGSSMGKDELLESIAEAADEGDARAAATEIAREIAAEAGA
jgi:hypothetical protein